MDRQLRLLTWSTDLGCPRSLVAADNIVSFVEYWKTNREKRSFLTIIKILT